LVTEMMNIIFILNSHDFSISALARWFLSLCLNVHAIQVEFPEPPESFHNEINRLKNLKELNIWVDYATELKEVTLFALRITITLLTFS
jgi:hypothetical protein